MKRLAVLLIGGLIAISNLSASHAAATEIEFSDMNRNYWAYHEIKFLTEKDVIRGASGKFLPNRTITRLDAAVMIGRAMNLAAQGETATVPADMFVSTRGYQEVMASLEKGMFALDDGKFRPNENLTRKDMARVLTVGFGYEGTGQSTFTDVPPTFPYYSYIDAISANDVTTGYSDGTFRPDMPVNRLQFSIFLARIYSKPLEYSVKQDGITLHKVRDSEEAISLAMTYPKATVHPVSNSMVTFSEKTGDLNQTGIHNGVLIYNGAENYITFSPEFFRPYITPNGSSGTLFDSFIFLGRSYPEGEFGVHVKNNANYSDWLWYLNQTFDEAGGLNNLNEAAKGLGKTVNVYIAIPYPKMEGTFMDLEGNKHTNSMTEREKIVSWYIEQTEILWDVAAYENLHFKGYYWFSETMGHREDEKMITKISDTIHNRNRAFIYSPHATSSNFEHWKNYGFDGAYLQPNTFRLKIKDTEARLHRAFLQAQIYGSGINLEIDQYGPLQIEAGLENFKQYIDMAHRYELSGQSLIFYQGVGMVDRMIKYWNLPSYNQAYQLLGSLAY
ncbi:DUF4855 domain-containing protein [Mesobacillus subterraneus]|uniref:SLH domain-containing protein n=1 Tax=Mesobacillus subterraneus TaxID=285983 RepID=A0A0D6ZGV6_9BACI|nr:DUF4855 domain-containing protein [Mesobacillus subterraneus]KIY23878.1 hypothetical protein UB32_00315 [Mesobacillus subterraneus]